MSYMLKILLLVFILIKEKVLEQDLELCTVHNTLNIDMTYSRDSLDLIAFLYITSKMSWG